MQRWFFLLLCIGLVHVCAAQRPVSIELPLYFSGNAIIVPEQYSQSVETGGGFGVAGGFGIKLNPLRSMAIRAGIEFWKNRLEAEYLSEYEQTTGTYITVLAKDAGNYRYAGFYTTLFFERKLFFFGGGLQVSAISSYKGRITLKDANGNVVLDYNNVTTPGLAEKNIFQANAIGMVGLRLGIKDKYFFKPTVMVGFPLLPLFDAAVSNSDFYLASVYFRIGLITEIVLKDWGAREKESRPSRSNSMPQDRW